MKVNRVIITGGPGTGKTSLIKQLENNGHSCIHETSREIIKDSLSNNSNILPWEDLHEFSEKVIKQREKHYHSVKSKNSTEYTFFDRGIPDTFAYMEYDNLEVPKHFLQLGNSLRYYPKVFLIPAWKAIFENDNERVEDFSKAELLQQFLHNTYKSLGYNVILVPKGTIENRIKFILENLEK